MSDALYNLAHVLFALGAVVLACTVGGWVALMRCKHPSPSFPQNGVQRCFDCGRWRKYEIDGHVGRWMR